ncbi:MAG: gliding motility-associated C-terminal domain-containing protein, partial [Muribaculaceae bacterium]|nr:gliding motility-associated C-terminal domain-containing protein [Muribaculaceae bacterium]
TVTIGDSELLCPNAFSPNDDGVNDIWKISYRSLLEFKCWIFDRTGKQLYHYTDPSGGWDGTYRGKKVKPGVYYYVIQAAGSDGKKYKKSGDINIIRYRGGTGSSTEPTE